MTKGTERAKGWIAGGACNDERDGEGERLDCGVKACNDGGDGEGEGKDSSLRSE